MATMKLDVESEGTVTLSPGTYFFTDLKLQEGATLRVAGPVVIYATGRVSLKNGRVDNLTDKPKNLQIYNHAYALPAGFAPTIHHLTVHSATKTYLAIYATDREVDLYGPGEYFGSVVSKETDIENDADFHYDLALYEIRFEQPVERIFWHELSLPPR